MLLFLCGANLNLLPYLVVWDHASSSQRPYVQALGLACSATSSSTFLAGQFSQVWEASLQRGQCVAEHSGNLCPTASLRIAEITSGGGFMRAAVRVTHSSGSTPGTRNGTRTESAPLC